MDKQGCFNGIWALSGNPGLGGYSGLTTLKESNVGF